MPEDEKTEIQILTEKVDALTALVEKMIPKSIEESNKEQEFDEDDD